jgi:hypothetical protein
MSIVTRPLIIVKDADNEFILDNAVLIALMTSLNAPTELLNPDNWRVVKANYKSTVNSQQRTVRMKEEDGVFKGNLKPSSIADVNFEVYSFTIFDKDFLSFTVKRNDLPTAELDLELSDSSTEIFGSWLYNEFDEESNIIASVSLKLSANFTYSLTQLEVSDNVGQSGVEKGTFTYDSQTGALEATVISDANGEWGFSHPLAPYSLALTNNGQNLELYEGGILQVTFSRV